MFPLVCLSISLYSAGVRSLFFAGFIISEFGCLLPGHGLPGSKAGGPESSGGAEICDVPTFNFEPNSEARSFSMCFSPPGQLNWALSSGLLKWCYIRVQN